MTTVFLRVLEANDKSAALLKAIREPTLAKGRQRFQVDSQSFSSVPRSPFAYWVSEHVRYLFSDLASFESESRTAKCGMGTLDDFRFLRLFWEVTMKSGSMEKNQSWVNYVGPSHRALAYADIELVVNWTNTGRELKCFVEQQVGSASRKIQSEAFYFHSGLTWPLRGTRFSSRAVPDGCVFSVAGKMAFVPPAERLYFLALFNSAAFDSLIALFAGKVGGVQYEAGLIQGAPIPRLADAEREVLARLAHRAWSLERSIDTGVETSHAFCLPALLQIKGDSCGSRAIAWIERVRHVESQLAAIQREIDDRCFNLYGIGPADRRNIIEGFGSHASNETSSDGANGAVPDAGDEFDEPEQTTDAIGLAVELISWAVGVAFGRFDLRLTTGARLTPTEPEPFDPLPLYPPGMLGDGGAVAPAKPPTDYPLTFPVAGILVDDAGHAWDLARAVRGVFDVVFGADADHWWNDVAALLDPTGHDIRVWLADSYFDYHLRRYSKSRRKAPILWQLGTPSRRYSVWLYAHRLTRDSFFQLQNEVVGPKVSHEERKLTSLTENAGTSPTASERKEIAAQEAVVEELRAMLDEVKQVAPLWNPDLDDGIVLTMAPFWRLVPQHRHWQKELKSKWDELAAGKYDWAHIAMHLWPERVVPKCAIDRSLAIAHGLEDMFWVKGFDGKWKARNAPDRPIEELVQERSSPAVRVAVINLINSAMAAAGTGRVGATRVGRTN
jgi:hypothetical protein